MLILFENRDIINLYEIRGYIIKILFLYPNFGGYGKMPIGMSLLMTILKNDGHQVELFDVSFIIEDRNFNDEVMERLGAALETDTTHLYNYHTFEEIDDLLISKLKSFAPDLVAGSIVEDNYRYCHRLLKLIKNFDPKIPTIVGGSTPSIAASTVIENPYIDYLIKGEAEIPLSEFCSLMEKNEDVTLTKSLYYKKNGEVHHNELAELANMEELPFLDLSFWDDAHFIKAYDGKLYRQGNIEMSRGCPQKCTYCINETWRNEFFETGSKLIRKKSVKRMIDEAKMLKEKHNLTMFAFADDNFLALTRVRMTEFRDLWKEEIGLPFWLNTTLESVSDWRLEALAECGCAGIGIGLESGNEWLRNEVLKRNTKNGNEILVETFELIKKYGIRSTANSMIGFPGETKADMFETVKLMKRIKPASYDITFVAPYIGTPIHELAVKRGLIDVDDRPGFLNMDLNIGYRRGAVMRNPYVSEEDANHIVDNFYNYVTGRLPIPEEFMGEAPGASETAPTRVEGLAEAQIIATIFKEAEIKKDNLRQSRKKKKYDIIPLSYIQGHEY